MLKKEELEKITESIRIAESHTSGEIRVYIARHCNGEPLETAYKKFHQLKMNNTKLRNGVLIFISITDHKAAIFGDEGINETVRNKNFWNEALDLMLTRPRHPRAPSRALYRHRLHAGSTCRVGP